MRSFTTPGFTHFFNQLLQASSQFKKFLIVTTIALSSGALSAQQASDIRILPASSGSTPTTTTPLIITWNSNSSGNNVIVVISDSTSTFTPTQNAEYGASTDFGAGSDVGTGTGVSKVVYNGASSTATTVNITNILSGSPYLIQIFEYTGTIMGGNNDEVYNVVSTTNNPIRFRYYIANTDADATAKWWAPASVTGAKVQAWGGGGAGSGRSGDQGGSGGGGGGGYSTAIVTVTPGSGYNITVAGIATSVATGGGSSGTQTWFSPTNLAAATIVANGGTVGGEGSITGPTGGSGGSGAVAGTATGSSNSTLTGGRGGTGSSTNAGIGGPGGSSAGIASPGVDEPTTWASLTSSSLNPAGSGRGGNGGSNDGVGNSGQFPGGGGGGAGSDEGADADLLGGIGAKGLMIISYQPPAVLSANTATTTQIKVHFNSTITSVAQANGSGFTVTGATITAAAIDGGDATVVNLTVNALSPTFSCTNCLTVAAAAVSSAGGSNPLVSGLSVTDGVMPTVVSSTPVTAALNNGIVARAGTITSNTGNNVVTGVGTAFLTELAVGSILKNTAGATIGTVANIADNENLTLTANAAIALAADAYAVGLYFTVTFTEAVTSASITAVDFSPTGSGTGTVGAISPAAGSSATYIVNVTPTGDGTLQLDKSSDSYSDVAGNASTITFTGGTSTNVDVTGPAVTAITPVTVSSTNGIIPRTGTITSGLASTAVTGVGTLFTTELVAGATIKDATGAVIGIVASIADDTNLTLVANAAIALAAQPYTMGLYYTVTFNEATASSSITTADFTLSGTGTGTIDNTFPTTSSSTTFIVNVTPTADGTLELEKTANARLDGLGNSSVTTFNAGTSANADVTGPAVTTIEPVTTALTGGNIPRAGTITSNTGSTAVTGVGTAFTTELAVGAILKTSAGSVIGTIQSITDNTNLTLSANALVSLTTQPFTVGLYYTVTFNEAAVASSVLPTDFVLSGTATGTIGTVSPTAGSSTTFIVNVSPMTSGTLELEKNNDPRLDGLGNSSVTIFNGGTSANIDVSAPSITNVTIADAGMNVTDVVNVDIAVADDGGVTYSLVSGTIGGFNLTSFSRSSNVLYTAQFTITNGGADVAAASNIPVNIVLADPANNQTTYTTAISQANDPIDANLPAAATVTVASVTSPVVANYYNASNTGIDITIPQAAMNDNSLDGGTYQIWVNNTNSTVGATLLVAATAIVPADINTDKVVSVSHATLSANAEYANPSTLYFFVILTDAGTNATTGGLSTVLNVDRTAPAAPGTPDLVAGSDSGISSTDNITNDLTPDFSVATVTTGNTVRIYSTVDAGVRGSIVATGSPQTVATTLATQGNGQTHSITATQVDPAGNESPASAGLSITLDATAPTISSSTFFASLTGGVAGNDASFTTCNGTTVDKDTGREFIHITMSEPLGITNGQLPTIQTSTSGTAGFNVSSYNVSWGGLNYQTIDQTCSDRGATAYHPTNVVHLHAEFLSTGPNVDGLWTTGTQFRYVSTASGTGTSNVRDVAGNELGNFGPATPGAAAPVLASSMVLNPNGTGNEIITFTVDQTLNTPTTAGAVTGITVDPDGAGPSPSGPISGTYSTTGNTITIQSAANNAWSTATTVSYSGGNLAGSTGAAMLAFGPEPILLTVAITSGDGTNGTWAKQGETISLTITASTVLALTGAPTATIGGLPAVVTGSNPYTATVTTDGTVPQGGVAFTINALQAGRSTDVTLTTDGSVVNYDNILPLPNPPTTPDLAAGSDTGFSNTDNVTSTNTNLVFSGIAGTVENNATVIVRDNTTVLGTTTALGDGSWTYTHTGTLADGVHPINIIARDAAFNVTSASTDLNITIDTSIPSVSSINRASATNLWSSTSGTSAASVNFTVVFSDVMNVSTLTTADFSIPVTGTITGAAITSITPVGVNSNTYTVTVGSYSGTGTLGLDYIDINDASEAQNIAGLLTGTGFTGQTYSIVLPEPNTQAITVSSSNITGNSMTISWNGTNVAQLPTHYLVLAVLDNGAFPTLEELDESAHYSITTGLYAKNVVRSGGGLHSVSFTGLSSGTTYDFRVYKYTLSSNGDIDYEMSSPGILNDQLTITASLSTVVQNSSATLISSLKDNNPTTERADVLQFTIYDDGLDPLVPNIMSFQPNGLGPETITMTLRGEITLAEGAVVTGFTNSNGTPFTAIYSGKNTTNTIKLTNSGANGTWTTGTTISYNPATGNVQFTNAAMGRMQPIVAHSVTAIADVVVPFNTPGFDTFIVPAGVTQITVETWGAGGSGGPVWDGSTLVGGASSGGGGGAYSRRTLSVTPGSNFSLFVGQGGAASLGTTSYVQSGNDGQDSYFGPSLVLAKGGQGGWNNDWTDYYGITIHANSGGTVHGLGGNSSLGVGDFTYSGGNGGYGYDGGTIPGHNLGVFGSGGGGGSSAGNSANGNNGANGGATCNGCGVVGGSAPTGGASGGIGWNGLAGNPGNFPGGGGGGTSQFGPFASGAGGNGRIVVTYAGTHPTVGGTSDWAADNAPFRFNQLVVSQGDAISPALVADWSTVIAGAELVDVATPANSINSIDNPANVVINPTNITFSGLDSDNSGDLGFIDDANLSSSSKTYTLRIWLKNDLGSSLASSIDGQFLDFKIQPSLQASITNDDDNNQRSSRIITAITHPEIESGASEITVDATQLLFNAPGNPAGPLATNPQPEIGVGVAFGLSSAADPQVYALDANNNLDLDYNKTNIPVTNTGGYTQSTNAMNFVNGMMALNPLFFTTGSSTPVSTLIEVTDVALPLPGRVATSTDVWPRISTLTTIDEGSIVPASELASFNSTTVAAPASFNFDFRVLDDNGADPNAYSNNDALPTLIQNITITQGSNNGDNGGGADASTFDDWTKSLAGARLQAVGSTQFVDITTTAGSTGAITGNQLSFNIPAGSFMESVPDGGSRTYQLKIWLRTAVDSVTGVGLQNILDNKDYSFAIDISNITLNTTSPNATSRSAASGSASTADGRNQVQVHATKLKFITHPAASQDYDSPITPVPVVKAVDAYGNVDLGYTGTPTLATQPNGARTYPFLASTDGLVNTSGLISFDNTGPDVLTITSLGGGFDDDATRMVVSGGLNDQSLPVTAAVSNSFILNYSQESDLRKDPTFTTYTSNIVTINNREAVNLTDANSIALERFEMRDGGADLADPDGTNTKLSTITLNVDKWTNIRRIGIYNGATEIKELDSLSFVDQGDGTANITFSAFINPFEAVDVSASGSGSALLTVRASFRAIVTDNEQIQVRIVTATATGVSSQINSSTTTFATLTTYQNRTEVVATKIAYNLNDLPFDGAFRTASISVDVDNIGGGLEIAARDAYNNLDADYNGTVSGSTNSSPGSFSTINNPATSSPAGDFVGGYFYYPTNFQFDTGDGNVQFLINSGAGSGANNVNAAALSGTSAIIKVISSFESTLINQLTTAQPINYEDYQNNSIAGSFNDGFTIEQLRLTDGFTINSYTDIDGANTVLTDITLAVSNPQSIRTIALYTNDPDGPSSGNVYVAQTSTINDSGDGYGTVTFSGLSITAEDRVNLSKSGYIDIYVQATFENTSADIVDNDLIRVAVISATVGTGSKFPPAPLQSGVFIGGVLQSSLTLPEATAPVNVGATGALHFLNVVATSLDFTTQPSLFAGKQEPIDGSVGTSPGGSTGIVEARDQNAVLDVDFIYAATVSAPAGIAVNPTNGTFNAGVLNLAGMQYQNAGNGSLTVTATMPSPLQTLNSDAGLEDIGNSIPNILPNGTGVDVIHVTALSDTVNVVQPSSLRGGSVDQRIFGLEFFAEHSTSDPHPYLKGFTMQFRKENGDPYPFVSSDNEVYKNFQLLVAQGGVSSSPVSLTSPTDYSMTFGKSVALSNQSTDVNAYDKIAFTFPGNGYDLNFASYAFYVDADIPVTVSVGTDPITPYVIDLGYSNNGTNDNIVTSIGSSTAFIKGKTKKFASTKPPVLVSTIPFNGQLNVDLDLDTLKMVFDVSVVSFDQEVKVWNRETGTLRANFKAVNGKYNSALPLRDQVVDTLMFVSEDPAFNFKPDSVYYVTVEKGVFSKTDTLQRRGISDEGFNLYGGIEFNGTFYFKGSSMLPPIMTGTDANKYYFTPNTATFNFKFNKGGTVHYMVVHPTGAPTTVTNDQILGKAAYLNSAVIARDSVVIDQFAPNYQFATINAALTNGVGYYVYAFAKNDAQPIPYATNAPYGAYIDDAPPASVENPDNDFVVGSPGPTFIITKTAATTNPLNNPRLELCANSSVRMEEPIIIAERAGFPGDFATGFAPGQIQKFNILLPTGFQFDVTKTPTLTKTNGGGDFQPLPTDNRSPVDTVEFNYINSTLLTVSFINSGSSSLDYMAISDLYIIASAPGLGNDVIRFFGNGLNVVNNNTTLARISSGSGNSIQFTNSYHEIFTKEFGPTTQEPFDFSFIDKPVTYIPDNFGDVVRLKPLPPADDYGLTTFSGSGLSFDELVLAAVEKDAAFNITLTHTDPNGCITSTSEQYLVYDYRNAISEVIEDPDTTGYLRYHIRRPTTSQNLPPKIGLIPGLVNPLTNIPGPPSQTQSPLDSISFEGIAGYQLIDLYANIPNKTSGRQFIDSLYGWHPIIASIPIHISGTDHFDGNQLINFKDYRLELSGILQNNPGVTNPYDALSPYAKIVDNPLGTGDGKLYFEGGSLGLIEFVGLYQSTADFGVYAPFRQEVELFIPAIPIVEVQGNQDVVGDTLIFCENGASFVIGAWPRAAAGVSTGTFKLYDADQGTPITTVTGFTDNLNGTAVLDPTQLKNSYRTIRVEYTFQQDASPAIGTGSVYIKITPKPRPNFEFSSLIADETYESSTYSKRELKDGRPITPLSFCEDSWIKFINTSTFPNLAGNGYISKTNQAWNLGEPQEIRINEDTVYHTYDNYGKYDVTFSTESQFGCQSGDTTISVFVGVIPDPAINMAGISTSTPLTVSSAATIKSGASYPLSSLLPAKWHYGDSSVWIQTPDTTNAIFRFSGSHTYANAGHYKLTLLQRTEITESSGGPVNPGCEVSYQRDVIIVPASPVPPPGTPFVADFDTNVEAWQVDDGVLDASTIPSPQQNISQQSSWKTGAPTTANYPVLPNNLSGPNGWYTDSGGSYLPGEKSYLYTSAYNFSAMSRPMLSFDQFTQTLQNDGIALDFSVDNLNITDQAKVWYRMGKQGEGSDWYNASGLASKPGVQTEYPGTVSSGDYGWSQSLNGWVNSRHAISPDIPTGTPIIFRFSLAVNSNATDVGLNPTLAKGIAIDNFRVGERTRIVVVENFTNSTVGGGTVLSEANFLKNNFTPVGAETALVDSVDYVKLNYHVGFPAQDPFNLNNPADPSARALYYGVTSVPRARMDGMDGIDYSTSAIPNLSGWGRSGYNYRTLDLAGVDIIFDSAYHKNGAYRVKVTVKANQNISDKTFLHVVLAERGLITSVTGQNSGEIDFEYVVRKMLPSASGRKFSSALVAGSTETFATVSWIPDLLYSPLDDMVAIVFVQDEDTKEIHQAGYRRIKDPSLVTAIENPFTLKDIKIYPNPADDQLNIVFPNALEVDVPMMMFDPVGRVTHNTIATKGTQSVTIDTRGNAQGVYILQMNLGEGNLARAKVIINHKE